MITFLVMDKEASIEDEKRPVLNLSVIGMVKNDNVAFISSMLSDKKASNESDVKSQNIRGFDVYFHKNYPSLMYWNIVDMKKDDNEQNLEELMKTDFGFYLFVNGSDFDELRLAIARTLKTKAQKVLFVKKIGREKE